jgi:Tfp pilus assembly protein FimT
MFKANRMWRECHPDRKCAGRQFLWSQEAEKQQKTRMQGWTLLELMTAVAIIALIVAMALPHIKNALLNYRLGMAASTLAAALQQVRYNAIMNGCYYTIALTAGSTTYQVQTQAITPSNPSSTSPPVCATNLDGSPNFTAAPSPLGPSPIPWTASASINVVSSTTLEFGASGVVGLPPSPATNPLTPCSPTCSFQLSNGYATKTISISGVGNVKVTSP